MSGRLASAWIDFERTVLRGASPVQRLEMRRAFYAGARAFLTIVDQVATDPGVVPSDREMVEMQQLEDELDRFVLDVVAGRA